MDDTARSETVDTRVVADGIWVVTIRRPEVRNAVDGPTAALLAEAFREFERRDDLSVAVLTGDGGTFCAGADLKAVSTGAGNRVEADIALDGPMGPTRMLLSKPVIAAVEGHAVAGGLELAAWCDLRVAAVDAVFGVYCRRWGVPLVDGGTVRLSRLLGHSHALDLILTGRGVSGDEALRMGLANRLVPTGQALDAAMSSQVSWPGSRSSACAATAPPATSSGRCPSRRRSRSRPVSGSPRSPRVRRLPAHAGSPTAPAATARSADRRFERSVRQSSSPSART